VTQSFYVHGRKTKVSTETDALSLEEANDEVERLLTKYPRREHSRRRFSHGRTAPEANTDEQEVNRYLDMARR
jgi:hypothetical protein